MSELPKVGSQTCWIAGRSVASSGGLRMAARPGSMAREDISPKSAPVPSSGRRDGIRHQPPLDGLQDPTLPDEPLLQPLPMELQVPPDDRGVAGGEDRPDLPGRHPLAA
jgi:hypothetical protein